MLPVSAMSDAANKLRQVLLEEIDDLDDVNRIRIGHPKDTLEDIEKDKDKNHLNLFFYNVSYDGYPADGLSEDPFYVRLFCLITAVGAKNGSPSAGENDLRLIGEVMRILHQRPLISVDGGGDDEIAQLQVVPHSINLDNLNHIWSTQGDTAYRLSVAYEMALAPVPLGEAVERSPRVGEPAINARGVPARDVEPDEGALFGVKPSVQYLEIDTDRDDWTPHICFVTGAAGPDPRLEYVFRIEGDLERELDILVAGRNNESVTFSWTLWRRRNDNSIVAWQEDIPDAVVPIEKEIKDAPGVSEPFYPNRIDPDNIDARRIFKVQLPPDVRQSDTKTWQVILHAVHEFDHESPAGSGNVVTAQTRSNPVLLYGEGP